MRPVLGFEANRPRWDLLVENRCISRSHRQTQGEDDGERGGDDGVVYIDLSTEDMVEDWSTEDFLED